MSRNELYDKSLRLRKKLKNILILLTRLLTTRKNPLHSYKCSGVIPAMKNTRFDGIFDVNIWI